MTNDEEQQKTNETEETEAVPKESGMRGLFGKARSAVSDGLDRAQEVATPHVERAREAATPHVERAQEAAAPHVERVQEAAAPHVERVQEATAPHVERAQDIYAKTIGAEFREEFTRYVNAATTTIVGLHQDQAATQERVDQLENEVETLKQRIADLENR